MHWREIDDSRRQLLHLHGLENFEPDRAWPRDINERQIRREIAYRLNTGRAIATAGNDIEIAFGTQHGQQSVQNHGLAVGDHYTDTPRSHRYLRVRYTKSEEDASMPNCNNYGPICVVSVAQKRPTCSFLPYPVLPRPRVGPPRLRAHSTHAAPLKRTNCRRPPYLSNY